jgi:catechol 2,3-dioxygenase-like lactoylglutathione lyase family enzyme
MAAATTTCRRFHFGLNVADLDRAVSLYRVLLGADPVKHYADYARFEVDDPPIVLALHPGGSSSGGALNHVGFRVKDSAALVAVQERLELNGVRTQREDGVECCYARQTKFWVPDADRNLWEIYTLEEDLEHSGFGGERMPPRPEAVSDPVVWQHMLTAPPPARIPYGDEEIDAVQLEGTYNADLPAETRKRLLHEIWRVLKPGGQVSLHGLVSDKPFWGKPELPGPAAMVRRIPVSTEPLNELGEAGFVGLNYDKLGDIHCFSVNGVELRELQLTAVKPAEQTGLDDYVVLYRGPWERITDDRGRTFVRGERTAVDRSTWRLFSQAPYAEHFCCFRCADQSHRMED